MLENIRLINCRILPQDLVEAAQAEYFSKARYHLESDVSNLIVNHKQQLDELQLLKMIKGQE